LTSGGRPYHDAAIGSRSVHSRLLSNTIGSFPRPCPHCGEAVRIDADRCTHCHTALERQSTEELLKNPKRLRELAQQAGWAPWERDATDGQRKAVKRLSKENDLGLIRRLPDGRLEFVCTGSGRHRRYVVDQVGTTTLVEEQRADRRRYWLHRAGLVVGLPLFFVGGFVTPYAIGGLVGFAILIAAIWLRPDPTDAVADADGWDQIGKGWDTD
jgi:hypothetical protein